VDAASIARHTGDVGVAQVARRRTDRTHRHTHTDCHRRDNGGPYTFTAIRFYLHILRFFCC
jgi:hypothetical protein